MKKFLSLLVLLCVLLSSYGCKEVSFDDESGMLYVGLECDYAPFNWTETSATVSNVPIYGETGLYAEGYDVQIAKLIASSLDKTLVIKKISWTGLIPALESGDIDVIIAGMSPTEDRKESINFTDNYYVSDHVVIVSANGDYSNAKTFSDFSGANVIGQKGTSYEILASQLATSAQTNCQTPLDTVPQIIASIISGVSDVTVVERPVALSICSSNPELTWIKLSDNFDVDIVNTYVAFGVRKVDDSLLERCNAALANITQEQRDALMLAATQAE